MKHYAFLQQQMVRQVDDPRAACSEFSLPQSEQVSVLQYVLKENVI